MAGTSDFDKMVARISERHKQNKRPSRPENKQMTNTVVGQNVNNGSAVPGEKVMIIMRKFIVKKNERGLLFREGDFQRFLDPGTYKFMDPFYKVTVEVFDLSVAEFEHRLLDFMLVQYSEEMRKRFDVVELNASQVGLVYKNKRLAYVLTPSTRTVFWKGIVDVEVRIIDTAEDYVIESKLAAELAYAKTGKVKDSALESIYCKQVPEYNVGVLYVDGACVKKLDPGLYAYWKYNRAIRIELFDTRLQSMDVAGQEILTKDKVGLRINLACSYQVIDALVATEQLPKINDYIYRELQLGLRQSVGTRTLDALLEDKSVLDETVSTFIRAKTKELGIRINDVGVKDIVLPGDMKTILGKVVEAEKIAQANSIRRREETAATRSMLNTAKVMEDNPTALRLKELETLEKVTEKVGNLSVYGGLDGLMNGLVKIN